MYTYNNIIDTTIYTKSQKQTKTTTTKKNRNTKGLFLKVSWISMRVCRRNIGIKLSSHPNGIKTHSSCCMLNQLRVPLVATSPSTCKTC